MGAEGAEAEACRERASLTFGSVVERRNDGGDTSGGDTSGGVPVREMRFRALAGSVVRRSDGIRVGCSAGVEVGDE